MFSPIAIIVSTNIHLFYDVYLMDPIDCQAVVVASASIYLMAFDYQELKGSLTYLLTYIGDLLLLFSASVQ